MKSIEEFLKQLLTYSKEQVLPLSQESIHWCFKLFARRSVSESELTRCYIILVHRCTSNLYVAYLCKKATGLNSNDLTQHTFDQHLDQRIGEIKRSQLSMSAGLDSSLHLIHTDMHQLAGRLFTIVERIENRLNEVVQGVHSESVLEATAGDGLLGKMPRCCCAEQDIQSQTEHKASSQEASQDHDIESDVIEQQVQNSSLLGQQSALSPSTVIGLKNTSTVTVINNGLDVPASAGGGSGTNRRESPRICVDKTQAESAYAPGHQRKQGDVVSDLAIKMVTTELPTEVGDTQIFVEGDEDCAPETTTNKLQLPDVTDSLIGLNTRFEAIDRKLGQIVDSMGIHFLCNTGDDDENRRRIKEKLKLAIESDRRSRISAIVSRGEMWLEYIFGICRPDQRLGKSGSRFRFFLVMSLSLVTKSAVFAGLSTQDHVSYQVQLISVLVYCWICGAHC